jgi:hypothetical protein
MEMQPDQAAVHQAQPRASIWEDFIDIFVSPREVFARRVDGRFGLALLVLTVLVGGLFYASQGLLARAYDADFQRMIAQMSESGNRMSEEQVAQMRSMTGTFATLGTVVAVPVGALILGVVIWALGKLFASRATLAVAMAIATYSQFPKILQTAASMVQGLLFDPDSMSRTSVGPARFVDPDTSSLLTVALLTRFDLFVLWSTVLVGVGLYVAGRVTKTNAAIAAALVWVIGSIPLLVGALRG